MLLCPDRRGLLDALLVVLHPVREGLDGLLALRELLQLALERARRETGHLGQGARERCGRERGAEGAAGDGRRGPFTRYLSYLILDKRDGRANT